MLEDGLVLDRRAVAVSSASGVEVQLDRAAVAVAGKLERALRAEDLPGSEWLAVAGVVADPVGDRAGGERDVCVEGVVAGGRDGVREVAREAGVEAARPGRAGVVAHL